MEKIKKTITLLSINIIGLIFLLLVTDYVYFLVIGYIYRQNSIKNNITTSSKSNLRYNAYDIIPPEGINTTRIYEYFLEKNLFLKPIHPKQSNDLVKNKTILLFGCSYTWRINENGLQGQLTNYTKSLTFNFAHWGWGAQHMYYLTSKPLLYEIINNNTNSEPKIAIYTYIRNHKDRLFPIMNFLADLTPYLTYKITPTGEIKGIREYSFFKKLLFRSFMYRHITKKIQNKIQTKYPFIELESLITESYNNLKREYPNIKFIILEYYQEPEYIPEEEQMFKNLMKKGIIYISTKELTKENLFDKKYTIRDGYHPNEKAWDIIVKPLAEKIERI